MALKNVFSFLETAPKHCSQDSSKVQQRQEQKRDQTGPSCVREVGGSQREGKYSFNAKQQGRLYAEAGTENLILAERLPSSRCTRCFTCIITLPQSGFPLK